MFSQTFRVSLGHSYGQKRPGSLHRALIDILDIDGGRGLTVDRGPPLGCDGSRQDNVWRILDIRDTIAGALHPRSPRPSIC